MCLYSVSPCSSLRNPRLGDASRWFHYDWADRRGVPMNPSKILIYVWLAAFVGACNASRPLECWQPALDARTSDVPMPVRIPTRIKVAPAGIVAEVEVGDAPPELSTLSPCIAAALKNLRFRAIPKPTELSIQFVFDVS